MGAEHPADGVGAGVTGKGADQHVDDQGGTVVRQFAEQHRVGQGQADPVDAEHGDRDRPGDPGPVFAAGRAEEDQQEGKRQEHQDVELGSQPGRSDDADQRQVGRDLERPVVLGHQEELAQAEATEDGERRREPGPADHDDRDHHDDPRDRDQDALGRFAHQAGSLVPKRRCRLPYSSSEEAKASRVKSGQSSSRKTNSE